MKINRSAIQKAQDDAAFGDTGWLTFYLEGPPERHAAMVPAMLQLQAVNLTDGVGGFVYAKVPVAIDAQAIEDQVSRVRILADEAGVVIGVIDLNSSADVDKSKFYTLWQDS